MSANPSWTNVPRHTTNFNPKIFISHIPVLNFAGTTRKQMTPRMCANPEPRFQRYTTKPQTLRPKIFISHICFELCRSSSPCYTTHVSQPILNQRPKTHCKLQIPKFSSHTSVFWTLPEQITPRMCANPEQMWQRYTTKPQTPRFSSHTSLFWTLPEQLSILHHACEPTHPEPTSQDTLQTSDPKIFISHIPVLNFAGADYTSHVCQPWTNVAKIHHKTSDPKIFISHICFELCRSSSPCYTTHVSQPILNQRPKTHCKLQIPKFSSHTSVFWTLPEQITPRMCANPEQMWQRYTTKPQTPRFSSHTSLFWTLPEQLSILHHACVPTHPEPTSQDTLQSSDPKIFISHRTLPEQLGADDTTHVCQPQNLRPQDFHHTAHISFELCRSSSPYYTTHVCQPILNQRPKTHYKLQIRKFSSHTSLFWTLPEQLGTDDTTQYHACVPTLNQRSKDTPQNLRP